MIFMHMLMSMVSRASCRISPSSMSSMAAVRSATVALTSMAVSAPITPAARDTSCCPRSKTPITKSKVWVTRKMATKALKNHLRKIPVSKSCMLFFSVTMVISS